MDDWRDVHSNQDDNRWRMVVAVFGSVALISVSAGAWAFNQVFEKQDQQLRELRGLVQAQASAAVPPGRRATSETVVFHVKPRPPA